MNKTDRQTNLNRQTEDRDEQTEQTDETDRRT
jgi:hypothetical protein